MFGSIIKSFFDCIFYLLLFDVSFAFSFPVGCYVSFVIYLLMCYVTNVGLFLEEGSHDFFLLVIVFAYFFVLSSYKNDCQLY